MTFGERLSNLRKKRGLSQQELANRLNISKSSLGMYETDKREPSFEITRRIAKFFGVSTSYLIEGEENITYDPLEDLKQYMIENNMTDLEFGFYDIEKWKKLGPDEIEEVKRHFDWVVAKAEQMEKEEEKKRK